MIQKKKSDIINAATPSDKSLTSDELKEMLKEQIILEEYDSKIWYQESTGLYLVHVYDDEGKRKTISAKTKISLAKKLKNYKKVTLKSLYPLMKTYRREVLKVKEVTIYNYDKAWDKYYIKDPIINKDLNEFSHKFIREWFFDNISKYKLTKKAYTKMATPLLLTFKYAFEEDIILHNPAKDFHIPANLFAINLKEKIKTYTNEEVEKIKVYIYEDIASDNLLFKKSAICFLLCLYTGVRIGEACPITWGNIRDGYLYIEQHLSRKNEILKDGRSHYIGFEISPYAKTVKGVRKIPLNKEISDLLDILPKDEKFVFYKKHYSKTLHPDCLSEGNMRKYTDRICKKAGIPTRGCHTTRKYFGTKLANNKFIEDRLKADIMGHTDISTLNRFYSGRCEDDEKLKSFLNGLS